MIPRKLRLKIIASIILTCAVIALIFGLILYPFEKTRRQARLENIELLLSSIYQQRREQIANEIFAGQIEALTRSLEDMQSVRGVAGITVYSLDGALVLSTDPFPIVVLPESERRALSGAPSFTVELRADPPIAQYATVIEAIGERVGYMEMSYDLSGIESESALTLVFFITLMLSLLLIMSVFLNHLLMRMVIRPVYLLREAMIKVREGRFGEQVSLPGRDEIGEMAEAFNDMSVQLEEKHSALTAAIESQDLYSRKLEESNRELEDLNLKLENMVDERTRELSESNLQLQAEIDERARAEAALATEKERLSITLRSIGDGVIATDTSGRVVLMNTVAGSLTGWSGREAIGRPAEEIFPIRGNGEPGKGHPVNEVLASGLMMPSHQGVTLPDRQGGEKMVSYSVAPIRDTEQKVLGSVLVFRDVTQQRLREEEARQSAKLESLGILAGGIAHDFNNIMTAILGNIALARMHAHPEDRAFKKLADAEKAINHAKGLTRQLLTFSKGGAPIKTTTSVRELLVDTTNFALSGSSVICRYDVAQDLWPLDIDPVQISQVINNLVINAIQAMPEGGLVAVSARNRQLLRPDPLLPLPPGRYVVIDVADNGMGITEELRSRIFDPYFTTKEKGSGLGLSTSYSIVKNHGGHLDLESVVGHGATFRIFLPAAERCGPEEGTEKHTVVHGTGRVLVMDDENEILDVTTEALELLGYSVDTAANGEEAIRKYIRAMEENARYDALIMDLTIAGGMGGKEAIRLLKEIDPGVRAVVSSGYCQDPVMAEFERFGFKGVLPKPFRLEKMSQVLNRVLKE